MIYALTWSLSCEVYTVIHAGWAPTGSNAPYNAMQRQAEHSNLLHILSFFSSASGLCGLAFHVSCISVVLSQLISCTRMTKAREKMLRVLASMLSSSTRCYSDPAGVLSMQSDDHIGMIDS